MLDQYLYTIGNWIESFGATLAAVAESQQLAGWVRQGKELAIYANAIQGVGNSLQAIAKADDDVLVSVGNWIEASGTITNSVAEYMEVYLNGETSDKVEVLGDVLQSLGSAITAKGLFIDPTEEELIAAIGNKFQTIGAAVEAIGVTYKIKKDERGQLIQTVGGWIQAFGTMLQAYSATKELKREKES